MVSTEVSIRPDHIGQLLELGISSTDLTIVCNSHGNIEDAELSVAKVLPDSIVFLEGLPDKDEKQNDFEELLLAMNTFRLESGKGDELYQSLKQAALSDLDEWLSQYDPKGPCDFTQHSLAKLKGLLEKDCLIYYADYHDLGADEDITEKHRSNRELLFDSIEHIGKDPFPQFEVGHSIGLGLRKFNTNVLAEANTHSWREAHAAYELVADMVDIVSSYDPGSLDLHRSEDGRLSTFLLYGTHHARSVEWRFNSIGLQPRMVEVKTYPEYTYIDPVARPGYNNHNRRLAHAAICSLTDSLKPESLTDDIYAETYTNLAYLNEGDKDERRNFLVACALIRRQEATDTDKATRQYLGLLRSFMPTPDMFITQSIVL